MKPSDKSVWVKGRIEPHVDLKKGYHSVPVRIFCEDGRYEWLWIKKSQISYRRASRARKGL